MKKETLLQFAVIDSGKENVSCMRMLKILRLRTYILLMNVEKAPVSPRTFSASFLTVKSSERERVSLVSEIVEI